ILFGRYFDPCVSPGGAELITKKQECKGSRSSVVYDKAAGKPSEGCFEMSKIDQDPHEIGVQADYEVNEIKLNISRDAHGKEVKTEVGRRPITARCKDELLEVMAGPHNPAHEAQEKDQPTTFPCWRPAYQPAVCPDLTDADKRSHGAAARPEV